MLFTDRRDAGRRLAEALKSYVSEKPFVIGLPRGGVVVAAEVAKALGASFDVLVVRKLGAPGQPELGIGAIAPEGVRVLNDHLMTVLHILPRQLDAVTAKETGELERRIHRYRGTRPMPDLRGQTVIVVDDGLATGYTARAAIRALRKMGVGKLILAVPVASAETLTEMAPETDDLVSLAAPDDLVSVGSWYRHFDQTTDEEVIALLADKAV